MNPWILWGGISILFLIVMFIIAQKTKNSENFIFGKTLGNKMARIKQRTQHESAMLGFALILISLVVIIIRYLVFSPELTIGWKIFYSLNSFFGILIVGSFLVTQFQQYRSFLESEKVAEIMTDSAVQLPVKKEEIINGGDDVKANGN